MSQANAAGLLTIRKKRSDIAKSAVAPLFLANRVEFDDEGKITLLYRDFVLKYL